MPSLGRVPPRRLVDAGYQRVGSHWLDQKNTRDRFTDSTSAVERFSRPSSFQKVFRIVIAARDEHSVHYDVRFVFYARIVVDKPKPSQQAFDSIVSGDVSPARNRPSVAVEVVCDREQPSGGAKKSGRTFVRARA